MSKHSFKNLRETYHTFYFRRFEWSWRSDTTLEFGFVFEIDEAIQLTPRGVLTIPSGSRRNDNPAWMDRLVFNFGMAKLVSYWKCACPPRVVVEAGSLSDDQVQWWKKLYFHGLGEFFYLNQINTTADAFMCLESVGEESHRPLMGPHFLAESTLIPVGGGKDSVVTLELLRDRPDNWYFAINPIPSALNCIRRIDPGLTRLITLEYAIDSRLLELNQQGFLNGHTPFSALVAFGGALAATLVGASRIALSNEASANEGNAFLNGVTVNHQYSKSLEFERDFRAYARKHLPGSLNYFSLLRPLHEIQIARAFARYEQYHGVFNSCNRGGRRDKWCGQCAKCLFTFVILAPFLSALQLQNIFGENLLENAELELLLADLLGLEGRVKPFDCVGSHAEVKLALREMMTDMDYDGLPRLLRPYQASLEKLLPVENSLLYAFGEHHIPPEWESRVRSLSER